MTENSLKKLMSEVSMSGDNIGIVNSEFKLKYLKQSVVGTGYDDNTINDCVNNLGECLYHDRCLVAMTPIAKYNGNSYMIGSNYQTVDKIKEHLENGVVLLHTFKKEDNDITYRVEFI